MVLHDPVLFAEVSLPFYDRDVARTIAAVQAMDMDESFKLAAIRELEKRRSLETGV